MKQSLKNVYDRLPPALRSVAASGYGYYLRSWRYGKKTDKLVEDALAREQWPAEQWQAWQQEHLAELLHRAATQVPYYRAHWQERRRHGDTASWEELANWPVLTKEALRTDPKAFLADDCDPKRLFELNTSGSSGTPVTVWRSRATMQHWYALFEARWRRWYGVNFEDRWAILGGKVVTPIEQEQPPFWVWNHGMNQLYMSTFHLKPANAHAYLKALEKYKIVYLYGYASSLHALASMALEQGLKAPRMRVALSNAEPLLPHQRESIGKLFDCPVRNTYGMVEAAAAASECEAGHLHLWPEVGVLEVFADDADEPVALGADGRLICTSLLNPDMPLIRYEVGDRGALNAAVGPCKCGRTLPRLERVVGRLTDNIVTADGRRIFQMDHVFYALAVKEAQIIQETVNEVHVKVVPTGEYSSRDTQLIRERLQERAGNINVSVEEVEAIPRSANNKFRAVISKVSI